MSAWFTSSSLFRYPGVLDKLCMDYSGPAAQHSILIPFCINSYAERLRAKSQLNYKGCIESLILNTAVSGLQEIKY